jgi:hypothetical protein
MYEMEYTFGFLKETEQGTPQIEEHTAGVNSKDLHASGQF